MPLWEYCTVTSYSAKVLACEPDEVAQQFDPQENTNIALNRLGQNGWELAGVAGDSVTFYTLFFKRPLEL